MPLDPKNCGLLRKGTAEDKLYNSQIAFSLFRLGFSTPSCFKAVVSNSPSLRAALQISVLSFLLVTSLLKAIVSMRLLVVCSISIGL